MQMLDAIEEVHNLGFIHRDVKASNFVLDLPQEKVYLVDFGLAKVHLKKGKVNPARKKADFRGTVSFASLNAHNQIHLARRDDLWSWYFVLLDFYNEQLKWRENKSLTMNQVRDIKQRCLDDVENQLWSKESSDIPEIRDIYHSINDLAYKDKPDYSYIRGKLMEILQRSQQSQTVPSNISSFGSELTVPFGRCMSGMESSSAGAMAFNSLQHQPMFAPPFMDPTYCD